MSCSFLGSTILNGEIEYSIPLMRSVLANGSPTKDLKVETGLGQGEPLSRFLFMMAVEALAVIIF